MSKKTALLKRIATIRGLCMDLADDVALLGGNVAMFITVMNHALDWLAVGIGKMNTEVKDEQQ